MRTFTLVIGLISSVLHVLVAEERYIPSAENLRNREWFRDAKYGLFIHWGVYGGRGRPR